jgi:hypothetical protein
MLKPPAPCLPDMINNTLKYRLIEFVNNKDLNVIGTQQLLFYNTYYKSIRYEFKYQYNSNNCQYISQ